jgi:hypothetical protein
MKHLIRLFLLGLMALVTFSCSESKSLMKGLSYFPQPLGYELISPIDSSAKTDSVIVSFTGFPLDSATTVHRAKGLIIPLIFIDITEFKYRIKLGASQMDQDFNDFFFNAIMDESQRSGKYALCYDSTRRANVYNLEVKLDTCLTDTHFLENSFTLYYVYGYFTTYSESSYPARSKVACSLKLRKGDQLLKDTTVTVSSMLAFENSDNLNRNERLKRTAECLVSTLCESTRNCISELVQTVNSTLVAQKR